MKERHTLLCTLGTSLLGNLSRRDPTLGAALQRGDFESALRLLLQSNPRERLCGAEINATAELCWQGYLARRERLVFLHSDTPDGRSLADLLTRYYLDPSNPLQFAAVEPQGLRGLRADRPSLFCRQGFKSLVQAITARVRQYGSSALALNATGGYKGLVAFAGTVGQAFDIPVYYLFEGSEGIIELPPQPLTLDLSRWHHYRPLLTWLAGNDPVRRSDLPGDAHLRTALAQLEAEADCTSLVMAEPEGDEEVLSLSAAGVLFHERSLLAWEQTQS